MKRSILLVGALLCALATSARADDYSIKNAGGVTLQMRAKQLSPPAGPLLPLHGLVDPNGNAFGLTNPLFVGPAIVSGSMVDRGGTVADTSAHTIMAANASRKGGWVTADPNNTGYIYVSLTGAASTTPGAGSQCVLAAGASCPLTVNGYVLQGAVSLAGTHVGDAYEAGEVQ